jgi:restriction system protein
MSAASTITSVMLPTYGVARHLLPTLSGVQRSTVTGMIESIYRGSGTPDAQLKWKDPSKWMAHVLEGEQRQLAEKIWEKSEGSLNPKYTKGSHLFLNKQQLLIVGTEGEYQISRRGHLFIAKDNQTTAEIDRSEGILQILKWISMVEMTRDELRDQWRAFALNSSSYRAESSIRNTLRGRLNNLTERGLIAMKRSRVALTDHGRIYLSQARAAVPNF